MVLLLKISRHRGGDGVKNKLECLFVWTNIENSVKTVVWGVVVHVCFGELLS